MPPKSTDPSRVAPAVGLAVAAMASLQLGGTLAKQLFPAIGAGGTTSLKLLLSALILCAVTRPWRGRLPRAAVGPLLLYGAALAVGNACFYLAIRTVPIGVAVTIDFLGPLGVAVAFSRRPADLVWIVLAALGIALLIPAAGDAAAALDPVGVAYALGSGLCWALYILAGRRLGDHLSSGRATALGLALAAVLILPFGLAEAGAGLFAPALLPLAAVVAVLSSAVPHTFEMMAMARLPARVFGVLMSLEPGFGALFGWLVLGEQLSLRQDLAVALVILASAGVTMTATRAATTVPAAA